MRWRISIPATLLLATAFARPALGQEGVRYEYAAPAGCPSEAEFLARVRERLLGASGGNLPIERRGLVVRVRVEPARGRASVEFQEADGAPIERAVQGNDCDELVSGVALITALAFGSRAEPGETAKDATDVETEPKQAPPEPEAAKAPAAAQPSDPAKPKVLAPMAAPPKTRTVTRGAPPKRRSSRLAANATRTRSNAVEQSAEPADDPSRDDPLLAGGSDRRPAWEAGAGGWVASWLSPDRTLGADAFLRAGARGPGWSARLSLAYGSGGAEVEGREAQFSFLGGRLEGCPNGFVVSGLARIEPCLAAELGQLRGTGQEDSALLIGSEQSVFWAAAVLVGRARAAISRRIVVEAQGELGIPITSHEFRFQQPETEVFSVPSFGGAGRIGIAVPFL